MNKPTSISLRKFPLEGQKKNSRKKSFYPGIGVVGGERVRRIQTGPPLKQLSGGGTGGETGRKGGGRCTGGGRRGGGKREKKGKIMQHCAIFRNRKNAKGRERKNTGWELGLKGTGSGRFKPPCLPPPPQLTAKVNV